MRERLSSMKATTSTRLAHLALWTAVIVAALAGMGGLLRPTPRAKPAPRPPEPTVAPEGFAEMYVAVYRRAGAGMEATLRPFYPGSLDLRDVEPKPDLKVSTATVAARVVGPDYWSVTVVTDAGDGIRYYQVAVNRQAGLLISPALPAEVAGPVGLASAPRLAVGGFDIANPDDPVTAAVGRFLDALLVGEGELTRYISPTAKISPVRPAPYGKTTITRIGTRQLAGPPKTAEVLAEVEAVGLDGRVALLQYSLKLATRQNRWEVTDLLPASSLSVNQPEGPAVTVAPPSTTSSTVPNTSTTARPATTTTTRPIGR